MADFFTRQQSFTAASLNKYSTSGARSRLKKPFKSQLSKKSQIKMRAAADVTLAKARQSAAKAFAAVARELGDGVDAAYNVIYQDFTIDVFDNWPVKTGFSKSQFDMLYSTRGQVLSANFVNYGNYTQLIQEPLPASEMTREKKTQRRIVRQKTGKRTIGNGVNVQRKMIFLPSQKVGNKMVDAIAKGKRGLRG